MTKEEAVMIADGQLAAVLERIKPVFEAAGISSICVLAIQRVPSDEPEDFDVVAQSVIGSAGLPAEAQHALLNVYHAELASLLDKEHKRLIQLDPEVCNHAKERATEAAIRPPGTVLQ